MSQISRATQSSESDNDFIQDIKISVRHQLKPREA